MISIQYLEPGPYIADISPSQARTKLQAAFDRLPIDCLLVGWDIPTALEEFCREVTARAGGKFYRWHPLLTGDGTIYPEERWRTRNLDGLALPGFRDLPEFTFMCPNHPEVRETILAHVADLAQSGCYDGIFLDRMRFPSPAADLVNELACFCPYCQQAAVNFGVDLEELRKTLKSIPKLSVLRFLLGKESGSLSFFLRFRQDTITRFITEIVEIIRSSGLEIGLDCFSPTLTGMVGQDLGGLALLADWTKIMVYGHALGPATLPFEITALTNWLAKSQEFQESEALATLSDIIDLPLGVSLSSIQDIGLAPVALCLEYARGQQMTDYGKLLAGIELVEIPGVSVLNADQIQADLGALKAAGADGLALSWDLWHMPLERLELVNSAWVS